MPKQPVNANLLPLALGGKKLVATLIQLRILKTLHRWLAILTKTRRRSVERGWPWTMTVTMEKCNRDTCYILRLSQHFIFHNKHDGAPFLVCMPSLSVSWMYFLTVFLWGKTCTRYMRPVTNNLIIWAYIRLKFTGQPSSQQTWQDLVQTWGNMCSRSWVIARTRL